MPRHEPLRDSPWASKQKHKAQKSKSPKQRQGRAVVVCVLVFLFSCFFPTQLPCRALESFFFSLHSVRPYVYIPTRPLQAERVGVEGKIQWPLKSQVHYPPTHADSPSLVTSARRLGSNQNRSTFYPLLSRRTCTYTLRPVAPIQPDHHIAPHFRPHAAAARRGCRPASGSPGRGPHRSPGARPRWPWG